MRFEPQNQIKESIKTFEKFPKITLKQFEKLYNESMRVLEQNSKVLDTPEAMFNHMLQITNKKVALPTLLNTGKPKLAREKETISREQSMHKLPGVDKKKEILTDATENRNESLFLPRISDMNVSKVKSAINTWMMHHSPKVRPTLSTHHNKSITSLRPAANLSELVASGLISPESIQPGDPVYRMLIREYYLCKEKSSEGTIGGFVNIIDPESFEFNEERVLEVVQFL